MTDLVGTWRVDSIADEQVGDAGIEIVFEADGSVAGSAGVNRLFGHYAHTDDRLTAGPLGTTRMAGPPEAMDREHRLLAALAAPLTTQFDDDGASLVLLDGDGTQRLRLVRADTEQPTETTPAEPGA